MGRGAPASPAPEGPPRGEGDGPPSRGGHRASERLRSPSRAGGGFLLDGSLYGPIVRASGALRRVLARDPPGAGTLPPGVEIGGPSPAPRRRTAGPSARASTATLAGPARLPSPRSSIAALGPPPAVPLRGTLPPPFGGGAGARSGLVLVGMSGLGARTRPPSNGPTAPRSRRWPFGVGGRSWRRAARGCPRPSAQRSTAFPLPSDAPAASRPRRGRGTCPRSARRRNVGAFGTQALYRSFRTSPVGSSSRRSLGPPVASPATSGGWGRPRAKRALRAPDRPSSRGVARYVAPVGR